LNRLLMGGPLEFRQMEFTPGFPNLRTKNKQKVKSQEDSYNQ